MGTAVSAIHGGAEGQWYNPAALAHVRAPELTVSRQAWIGQTRDDYLGAALPMPGGALGLFANVLGTDDISRDAFGNEGAKFNNNAWAAGLGYGVRWGWLSLGGGAKMVQERFAGTASAGGFGGDVGAQLELGVPWLRLGGAAQNIGALSGYQPKLGGVELPLTYRAGLALDQALPGLLLSVELRQMPLSRENSVLAGGEWARFNGVWGLALRAGYEGAAAKAGELAGLAMGGGVRFYSLRVDFAYTPYGAFGNPYRMTLGWDFSGPRAVGEKVSKAPAAAVAAPQSAEDHDRAFREHYAAGRKAEAIAALEQRLALKPDASLQAWLEQYRALP